MHKIIRLLSLITTSIYKFRVIQNLLFKYSSVETTILNYNIKLKLVTGDLISNYLYHFRTWEPCISNYVMSQINSLMYRSFIDIGANIGYFSVLIASNQSKCVVYSYEPSPLIFKNLQGNVRLNALSNVELRNMAISDKKGSLEIFAGHALNSGSTGVFDLGNTEGSFSVKAVTLLEEVSKYKYPPKIIKIDTEGSELMILSNLNILLNHLPDDIEFIVEINPELIGLSEANSIIKGFQSLSFRAFELTNSYDILFYVSSHDCEYKELVTPICSQKDILFKKNLINVGGS